MAEVTWRACTPGIAVHRTLPARVFILRTHGLVANDLSRVGAALQLTLTEKPNTGVGTPRALWLGPDEFMVFGPVDPARTPSVDGLAHWADATDAVVAYQVEGARARALLSKGCTMDLHARAFQPGRCAQTLLAQVGVVIDRPTDAASFDVYAERSYAHHLDQWFEDAIVEFRAGQTLTGAMDP